MITFPDYDFGMYGGTDAAEAEATAQIDASAGTKTPAPELTVGVVFNDLAAGVGSAVKTTGGAVADTFSGAANFVTSKVRNTYLYLVGGVLLIGIVGILVFGAGTRFLSKMEGRLP